MKAKIQQILRLRPAFLFLLPAFFVLHGLRENYGVVPVPVAWLLFGTYVAVTLVLTGLAWIGYRHWMKSALFAACMMTFHFFFGAVHDLLRDWFPGSIITRHTFILPFSLLLFITLAIVIKKRKSKFSGTAYFFNVLLLLLLVLDIGWLTFTIAGQTKPTAADEKLNWNNCDTCKRPDIYLVIADGYPGRKELTDILKYDNQRFEDSLRQLGFYITDSSMSNYNFTTYSMASMLNLEYLQPIIGRYRNKTDLAFCYERIRNSKTVSQLRKMDYEIINNSIFDIEDLPSSAIPTFLPRKSEPITNQTFLSRMEKELAYHLATTLKIDFVLNYLQNHDLKNNRELMRKTKELFPKQSEKPRFVYTHLVMPHRPYYFDSTGSPLPMDTLTEEFGKNVPAFISYLKYCNRELTGLVRHIKEKSATPPIIILMSDHGFREFSGPVDNIYQFYTLNAVYLPDSNYTPFYKGMSNVNQFRAIFNSTFGQQMPMLKDSTSYLID